MQPFQYSGHGWIRHLSQALPHAPILAQPLLRQNRIDYTKMSDEDKAKEKYKRTDGDYALSWIRREGKGRVFVEVLGHSEHIYSNTPMMEHVLAGIQYALGD
jgi:hypothetical protein